MNQYMAPPADDPVNKLQNLLQNTLYSFADITITLAPEKALEFKQQCANLGITLPEAPKESESNVSKPEDQDNSNPEVPLNAGSITDRVNRIGILNDHIQATVNELPDMNVTKADLNEQIRLLHEENERAAEELQELYGKYNDMFQLLRKYLNKQTC